MGKLVKENDILIYKLKKNQPNDLYRIPKELAIGIEKTAGGKTGVTLTSKDINKLRKILHSFKIRNLKSKFHGALRPLLAFSLSKGPLSSVL